jgi:hypothetical protein
VGATLDCKYHFKSPYTLQNGNHISFCKVDKKYSSHLLLPASMLVSSTGSRLAKVVSWGDALVALQTNSHRHTLLRETAQ